MANVIFRRAAILLFVSSTFQVISTQNSVPDVNIEVLSPKGIRVTMPGVPKMTLFAFNGHVNRPISKNDVGTIQGEVLQATDGKWVLEDHNVELKEGDVINYYIFVAINRVGLLKDNLSYTVTSRSSSGTGTGTGTSTGTDNRASKPPTDCPPSETEVRSRLGQVCSGQTVFEDHFDSLQENIWQIEQYIPIDNPEYPFVSYQRLAENPTVYVEDGYLNIKPQLQADQPGFNNMTIMSESLNLFAGCTAPACWKQASGADILPPVVSGRVTSKGFAFKYGTIHIRAKLPQGDWLYPEILLEPFLKRYGNLNYASGVLRIASAKGNKELTSPIFDSHFGSTDFSNSLLTAGPIMDFQCRQELLYANKMSIPSGKQWGDDFHEYSLRWSKDRIILMVDGQEWRRIEAPASGLSGLLPQTCTNLPRQLLAEGSRMAPFDDLFQITLGVAAGGISEFQDNLRTRFNRPKPWRNGSSKGMLKFWQDVAAWHPTWTQPALQIDYVKVIAL